MLLLPFQRWLVLAGAHLFPCVLFSRLLHFMGEDEKTNVCSLPAGGHRPDFAPGHCRETGTERKEVTKSYMVVLVEQINPNNLLHAPHQESAAKKVEISSVPYSRVSEKYLEDERC